MENRSRRSKTNFLNFIPMLIFRHSDLIRYLLLFLLWFRCNRNRGWVLTSRDALNNDDAAYKLLIKDCVGEPRGEVIVIRENCHFINFHRDNLQHPEPIAVAFPGLTPCSSTSLHIPCRVSLFLLSSSVHIQ